MGLRLFDVDIGVVHDEEMSSRGNSRQQPTFRITIWSVQQCGVVGGDEVVPGSRQRRIEQPGMNPFHIDMELLGGRCGTLQCDSGYVDRGDSPASASQPDGVGSLAASHVERGPRLEVTHFGDERSIGFPAPHLFGPCVPLVPFGVVSFDVGQVRVMGTPTLVTVRFGLT